MQVVCPTIYHFGSNPNQEHIGIELLLRPDWAWKRFPWERTSGSRGRLRTRARREAYTDKKQVKRSLHGQETDEEKLIRTRSRGREAYTDKMQMKSSLHRQDADEEKLTRIKSRWREAYTDKKQMKRSLDGQEADKEKLTRTRSRWRKAYTEKR